MRVRCLVALSFFHACAAIAADNTPPAGARQASPRQPVNSEIILRVTKVYWLWSRLVQLNLTRLLALIRE